MKIWLSKNSEISIHEQIVAQITLGIASGDLKTNEKIPSTRELARRFQVHSNTVNLAYKELAEQGLVEFRKGSGVFVRENESLKANTAELDQIIAKFLYAARANGFELSEIQKRLKYHLALAPPEHFLLVESDEDMRRVIIEEIGRVTSRQIVGISVADFQRQKQNSGAQVIALSDERENVQPFVSAEKPAIFLKLNSVSGSMKGQTRPSEKDLIAIVSHWEKFLLMAKMYLLAAQIDAETLMPRSTKEKNWRKGLDNASMIICDSLTEKQFSDDQRVRVFRLISDQSLSELKNLYNETAQLSANQTA